ncbi:MAG: aa3-type cytochrome c oxidase subunit IV [Bauldia sp.]|nr:aa3-type cytochrome c oxidase subunit IV [Bauldia sp.]
MAAHGADHGGVEIGMAATVDYATHERTYRSFLGLLKYSMAGIALILILMAFFLL